MHKVERIKTRDLCTYFALFIPMLIALAGLEMSVIFAVSYN